MSRPRIKSKVFDEGSCLGEAVVIPTKNQSFQFPNNEIRITRLSPPSERCHPLSVLLTISPLSVCCKIESGLSQDQPLLNSLHFTCLRDRKTAVVSAGEEDLHLVAMMSKNQNYPCFWCCSVPVGLYEPCLAMLNLRCLAIVFDLDETLIVANTMKSFEDRIEAITRRISDEDDPGRISGMSAELKRYLEDKALLKQYAEGDHILDNGRLIRAQNEEVLSVSDGRELIVRPVIRLQERNTILTRINPEVRDTSVLVRLRPAWEDLRSYLTAKGRKRFEVYVCTMAERDYALEMWRLLDPESHLISSTQLLNRVVCVKSGLRKSLSNVFQDGNCHPQMAMVIDDRLKVWDDKDQPRVHVVPAFMPYYAPQAETANAVPVLCVARNVACNVRGGFFREFDENLLRKIYELCYEDETQNLPQSPDVSDYLIAEDAFAVPNGNPVSEGMTGAEVERRLHNADEKRGTDSDPPLGMAHSDVNHEAFQQPASSDVTGVPVCRETVQNLRVPGASAGGKVTQSETGLDTRLPKMEDQNYLNLSQLKTSAQRSVMVTQPCGGWLVEDINPDQFTNQGSRINQEFESLGPEKHLVQNGNSKNSIDSSGLVSIPQVEEAHCGDQRPALLAQSSPPFLDEEGSQNQLFKDSKDIYAEGSVVIFPSVVSIGVLLEIGKKCDYKVEFRSIVSTSKDLQSVEVLFTGEKIGIGTGKTLKEANLQAAENALHNLASKYAAFTAPNAQTTGGESRKFPLRNENGILSDTPIGSDKLSSREPMPDVSRSGLLISPEDSERLSFLVSNIRELCMTEGLRVAFQDQPPASVILNRGEFYHQVEIDGQILGKGIGLNKDKAKLQAAEEALQSLKSTVNQQTQKPPNPQRSQAFPNKRLKVDNSRGLHGTSSSRYHKNGQPTS